MKKFLAGLTTGLFMVVLVGLSQAAPNSSDDVYNDSNPCDWSEFEEYETVTDIKMLIKKINEMPASAAGCVKVVKIEEVDEEDNDCDWSEFEE